MVNARSLSFSRPGKSKPSQDQSSLSAALDLASAPAADSPTLHRPSVTPQPPAKSGVKASPRTSWMARNLSFRASKKQLTPGEAAAEPPQQAITPSPPISLPPTAYTASAQLRTPIPVGSTPVRAASVEIVPAPAAPTSSSLAPPAVPDSSAPPLAPLDRARALATDAVPFELAPATEPATTDEAGDDEEEPSATETESQVASLTATNAELAQAVTVLQNEVEEAKGKLRSPDSVSSLSPESEEAKRVMSQVKIDAEARRLNEEKVASARKLAFDAAEKAAEAARLASMSEEELTNMQLGSKLGAEQSTTRDGLQASITALEATEQAMSLSRDSRRVHKAAEEDKIRSYEQQVGAFDSMLRTITPYDEQCEALKTEVEALAVMEDQRRGDSQGISGRVQRELAEAETRLGKQNAQLASVQKQLIKHVEASTAVEAKLESELAVMSSGVAAKMLTAELAKRHLAMVCAEQAKLMDISNDEPRIVQGKRERAEDTAAQIEAIKQRIVEDELMIARCKRQEHDLQEAGDLADAAAQARSRAYEIDRHCVTCTATLQDSALQTDLSAPHPTIAELADGLAPTAFVDLTRFGSDTPTSNNLHRLQYESRALLLTHRATTEQAMELIESAEGDDRSHATAAHEERQSTLRQVRAERKAVESALLERQRFLADKASQLEVEQRQLYAAESELTDQQACIHMLQGEIELAQASLGERTEEANAADRRKTELMRKLEATKLNHKLTLGQLRNRCDSERRVQVEQAQYVESLRARLKVEAQGLAEERAMEENAAASAHAITADEAGAAMQAAVASGAAAPAPAADSELSAAPPGKVGLALVTKCSMRGWTEGLREVKAELEELLEATRTALTCANQKSDLEERRLAEQRIQQLHQVSQLREYEHKITTKLSTVKIVATIDGPSPSSPDSTITVYSRGAMAGSGADGDGTVGSWVPPVLDAEPQSTPYKPRYLDMEKFGSPDSVATLLDERSRLGAEGMSEEDSTLQALRKRVSAAILG